MSTRFDDDDWLPVKAAIFWTAAKHPVSAAVRYFTRPHTLIPWRGADWSHVGLAFEWSDGGVVRHEALLSEGWTSKVGWHGLQAFVGRGNRARIYWLPWPESCVYRLYRAYRERLGQQSYAIEQIAQFAIVNSLAGRLLKLQIRRDCDRRVICSEGVAREVYFASEARWDLRRDPPAGSFDAVTPHGAFQRVQHLSETYPGGTWQTVPPLPQS